MLRANLILLVCFCLLVSEADSQSRLSRKLDALILELDNRFDPGRPDFYELERLNCSQELIEEAQELNDNWDTDGPKAVRIRNMRRILARDRRLSAYIKRSKNSKARYVKARLVEEEVRTVRKSAYGVTARSYQMAYWAREKMRKILKRDPDFFRALMRYTVLENYIERSSTREEYEEALKFAQEYQEEPLAQIASFLATHYSIRVYGACSGDPAFVPLKQRTEIRKWNCRAADLGSVQNAVECGSDYHYGIGGKRDFQKAREYYELAASKGHPMGFVHLAYLYRDGDGVEIDGERADELECQAALRGGSIMDQSEGPFPNNLVSFIPCDFPIY